MFLGMLNDDEKKAFASLAERMIDADGLVIGGEKEAVASLCREMGVAAGEGSDSKTTEELAATFGSHQAKVVALLELVGLGHSDAHYSVLERSFVNTVASAMGLDSEEVEHIEGWVLGHVRHIQSAFALMQG